MSGATLSWKISDCLFSSCPSLTQTQSVTGNVTKETDAWAFTDGTGTYDAATGETSVAFTGTVEVGNTAQGGYRIRVIDPVITVDNAGAGTVTADIDYRTSAASPFLTTPLADVTMVNFTVTPTPAGDQWTATPPWDGVGTEGSIATTPIATPVAGRQFAQAWMDAFPTSLKAWFYDSGTGSLNGFKAPAPLNLNLALTGGGTPGGGTPGGGTPGGGSDLPTPPYSGELGSGGGIPGVDAGSGARSATSGYLDWGVKSSFRQYITGGIANGSVSTGGVSQNGDGSFRFPLTGGSYNPTTGRGVLNFGGSVRFTGHAGALDMTVSNPQLQFTGGSTLYASISSKSLSSGAVQSFNGAMGNVSGGPSLSGDTLQFGGLSVSLTGEAAPGFGGFYSAGADLDAVSGQATLGAAAAGGGSTTSGTGSTASAGTGPLGQ